MSSPTTKVALVTGAARGIGHAIALRLADDGFDVAVNDIQGSTPELDELVKAIQGKGQRSLCVPADISLEPKVEKIIQQVVQELGSLDVMVANAGIISYESFLNITVESFDRLMAVNVRGTMLCYKHAAKQMIAQGRGGRIIGACSQTGKQAHPVVPTYGATKFAIRGLTQAAAQEFGPHGITVNATAPGLVDTPLIAPLKAPGASGKGSEALAALLASTPIQRIGEPEDVAGLVSYLASDIATFITGQCVSINGGSFFD